MCRQVSSPDGKGDCRVGTPDSTPKHSSKNQAKYRKKILLKQGKKRKKSFRFMLTHQVTLHLKPGGNDNRKHGLRNTRLKHGFSTPKDKTPLLFPPADSRGEELLQHYHLLSLAKALGF